MRYFFFQKQSGKGGKEWPVGSEKPKDWEFMRQSGEVLEHLPETWTKYADNEEGMRSVIEMEYGELMKAETHEAKMHELVHLASACLRYWRHLNDANADK